jgi:hypothetical protein
MSSLAELLLLSEKGLLLFLEVVVTASFSGRLV